MFTVPGTPTGPPPRMCRTTGPERLLVEHRGQLDARQRVQSRHRRQSGFVQFRSGRMSTGQIFWHFPHRVQVSGFHASWRKLDLLKREKIAPSGRWRGKTAA